MPKYRAIPAIAILVLALAGAPAFAYDPPAGGLLVPLLGSPYALSTGPTVTAIDAPWADRLNPAASAGQQRPVLDAGYSLLSAFDGSGAGHALSLGLSLPKPYGVWGAGFRFVTTPDAFALPLGTLVEFRGGIGKDLFPNFLVGAGLTGSLGGDGGFGWGLGLDLGILHRPGDLGFLKDFRWGLVLSGLGKGYDPTGASTGVLGGTASSFPAPFTLSTGARALLLRGEELRIGAGLDLSFPALQDFGLSLSGNVSWKDIVTLRAAWGFHARELLAGSSPSRSLVPSIGLSATIPVERKGDASGAAKPGWERGELRPSVSVAPLYGSLLATSVGLSFPIGLVDRKAPEIAARFPASSWGPFYLSPNADGAADVLDIPLSITDQRYIASYAMTVRRGADESSPALRTLANKESRPETQGLEGVWARLVYVKKGVPVPEKLSWNGILDSGEVAADGEYSLFIEAVDDNGNRAVVGPFPVTVDATPPAVELGSPPVGLIFSPDGDGNKDSIAFRLSGSVEDLWTARVVDSAGQTLRTVEWKGSAPADFTWDGKGDSGAVAPDGVYGLVVTSTDRAGNKVERRLDNILVNTQQPPVNLAIDSSAFSPNGDGARDTITLSPSVPVRTGLATWRITVLDRDKREAWSVSGSDSASLKERFVFDGRGADLKSLPEGQYQARLAVTYVNGHSPQVLSPAFILDVTPPQATVKADRGAFNPAGREGQNAVRFAQSGSREERWIGEIVGPSGSVVRAWTFPVEPDLAVEWDGSDDSGAPLPDGAYAYRLRAQDKAGNSFASAPAVVSLDTEKKAARVAVDQRAFSPNGDGQKDVVKLTLQVQSNDRVRAWELQILPSAALDAAAAAPAAPAAARSWKGTGGVPESLAWDGASDAKSRAADGRYAARLRVSYLNDDLAESVSPAFALDTVPPQAQVQASPLLFSPNGDKRKDEVRFAWKAAAGDDWEGRILDASGKPVRTWSWKGQPSDFAWDGSDEAGNRLPDGAYRFEASSTDAAGNRGATALAGIRLDSRPVQAFVTSSAAGLSPNGDGAMDDVAFSLIVNLREGIESWKFSLLDKSGKERASFSGEGDDVPSRIAWDGKDSSGIVAEGEVSGLLAVSYAKGDLAEARTGTIAVDVTPPAVSLKLAPPFFSPDNDGVSDELEVDISVSDASAIADWKLEIDEASVEESAGAKSRERLFIAWTGKGVPAKRVTWDGRSAKGELVEAATDYPFYFDIKDAWGNAARIKGSVAVDVLVIRDGDRLKIKVPSIVFRPNFADFVGLEADQLDRNARVIRRIAEILNKFRDYRIQIEGHANSVAKIYGYSEAKVADEEQKELIPLSTNRADLVRKLLVEYGVDAKRLTVLGRGSSEPVTDFKDAENRWKNRRVEFILIKNP